MSETRFVRKPAWRHPQGNLTTTHNFQRKKRLRRRSGFMMARGRNAGQIRAMMMRISQESPVGEQQRPVDQRKERPGDQKNKMQKERRPGDLKEAHQHPGDQKMQSHHKRQLVDPEEAWERPGLDLEA